MLQSTQVNFVSFLLLFAARSTFSQSHSESRQACFKFQGPCELYPEWGGTRDDSEWAYLNLDVGKNREKCLSRAKEYFEWCGNREENVVRMVHVPSGMFSLSDLTYSALLPSFLAGAWAVHPPQDIIMDTEAFENARVWEIASRFRTSAAQYAPGGALWSDLQKHGIDGGRHTAFLDIVRHLYSTQDRNLTEALRRAAHGANDGNAAYLGVVLEGAWERGGAAGGEDVIRRLEDCAWRRLNPLCHMALGYRRQPHADALLANYVASPPFLLTSSFLHGRW